LYGCENWCVTLAAKQRSACTRTGCREEHLDLRAKKQRTIHFGCNRKNNEKGVTCGIYGGKREMRVGFWWGELREKDHFKDIGVGVKIILKKLTLRISVWRV